MRVLVLTFVAGQVLLFLKGKEVVFGHNGADLPASSLWACFVLQELADILIAVDGFLQRVLQGFLVEVLVAVGVARITVELAVRPVPDTTRLHSLPVLKLEKHLLVGVNSSL